MSHHLRLPRIPLVGRLLHPHHRAPLPEGLALAAPAGITPPPVARAAAVLAELRDEQPTARILELDLEGGRARVARGRMVPNLTAAWVGVDIRLRALESRRRLETEHEQRRNRAVAAVYRQGTGRLLHEIDQHLYALRAGHAWRHAPEDSAFLHAVAEHLPPDDRRTALAVDILSNLILERALAHSGGAR